MVYSAASACGATQSWFKQGEQPMEFGTMTEAEQYADKLNRNIPTPNVHYYAKEMGPALVQSDCFLQQM